MKEIGHLIRALNGQADNFRANGDYYRECFARDMEEIVDEARTEIESHTLATQHSMPNPCRELIEPKAPEKPTTEGHCPCPAPMYPEGCEFEEEYRRKYGQ